MMKNYYSFSAALKLFALVLFSLTFGQQLSAQVTCHTDGTISVNLGASGSKVIDGSELVQNLHGHNIANVVLRLDGMNGAIIPNNTVNCSMLLGGPRTIWAMVETDEPNSCMTTFILQDKFKPTINCSTTVLTCSQDFSAAPAATAVDNCGGTVGLTMNEVFNTTISGFDGLFSKGSLDASKVNATIGETWSINGTNSMLTVGGANSNGNLAMTNLIKNGNFEGSNTMPEGFTSDYAFSTSTNVTSPGQISIRNSMDLPIPEWVGMDHTNNVALGKFLVCDASLTPSQACYRAAVPVVTGQNYTFSGYFNNVIAAANTTISDPVVQVFINGVQVIANTTLPENPDQWVNLTANWTATTTGNVNIEIKSASNVAIGNDFIVDDLAFYDCTAFNPCMASVNTPGCENAEVCIVAPIDITISFDWANKLLAGSGNFEPAADPSAYKLNNNYVNLTGTSGSVNAVVIPAGQEFCFVQGSNNKGCGTSFTEFSNLTTNLAASNSCTNDYIIKKWTATDQYGNSSDCLQLISKKIESTITFPMNATLQCTETFATDANGNPSPTKTGVPTGCNLNYTYTDVVIPTIGCAGLPLSGCRKINRTWHAVNTCTMVKQTGLQQISIVDNVAPVFVGLPTAPLVVGTRGTECTIKLNYQIPIPTATDNCSSVLPYTVVTNVGTITNNILTGVPPGPFTLTYRVEDCCGNARNVAVQGTVVDNAPPSAVCDKFFTTSLTNDGTSKVFASTFDEGSNDNCNPVWFKTIRMVESACATLNGDDDLAKAGNQVYFDDAVFFCCEDLMAGTHQVIFRTFDVNPGAGPVNPARMNAASVPPGDLVGHFNDCMVTVTVEDKAPPTISCPTSVTVSCEYTIDLNNLATTFGTVRTATADVKTTTTMDPGTGNNVVVVDGLAAGNCMLNPQERPVQDLRNTCGIGNIVRTFQVGNGSQQKTCTQIITVADATPFGLANITWPAAELNYTNCMQATDPSVTGVPTVTGDGICAQISITHTDQNFPVEPNSCFKVKRTWTVKDICQHNTANPSAGVWTFVQTIAVKNNIDPTFASCTPINASCNGGALVLTQTVNDDCTPKASLRVDFKIDINNDGSYQFVGGNNNPTPGSGMTLAASTYDPATGIITVNGVTLPSGTHRIIWSAEDLCSNVATCTQIITSGVDTAPPVKDIHSSQVSDISNTAFGNVTAVDNCTPAANIVYTWEIVLGAGLTKDPAETDPTMGTGNTTNTISYIGAGNITFNYTFKDAAGNTGTFTDVIAAAEPPSAIIAGAISNEAGQMVEDVQVEASANMMEITDNNGAFEFLDAETGLNYSVDPSKNDDPRNGISTLDLVLISRHMIGLQPLNSPFKMIAADVNNSESIDVFDLVELQKLLLWTISNFNNNESWRFIDATHTFNVPTNPWSSPIPESYEINGLSADMMGIDFTAVKIGDVNGDAVANAVAPAQVRSYTGDYNLQVQDQTVEANELSTIDFVANESAAINGLQLTIDFGQLDMNSVEAGMLDVADAQIAYVNGQYILSVVNTRPVEVAAGDVLFSFNVTANTATSIANELQVNNELINSEVYTGKDQLDIFNANVQIVSDSPITDVLYQNRPNPFKENTTVGFYLVNGGQAKLSVYDVSGKLIKIVEGTYSAGYNQIELNAANLAAEGVVFYQLDTENFTASRRMIIVK